MVLGVDRARGSSRAHGPACWECVRAAWLGVLVVRVAVVSKQQRCFVRFGSFVRSVTAYLPIQSATSLVLDAKQTSNRQHILTCLLVWSAIYPHHHTRTPPVIYPNKHTHASLPTPHTSSIANMAVSTPLIARVAQAVTHHLVPLQAPSPLPTAELEQIANSVSDLLRPYTACRLLSSSA